MPKKSTNSGKTKKSGKKLGRPEELNIEDLPKRFWDMKQFLQNYWGRIGLGLRSAREPEDVRTVLTRVQSIEWMTPFKGHAICLIHPNATRVTPNKLRETRRQYNAAEEFERSRWADYQNTIQQSQQAATAFQQMLSQFEGALDKFEFFFVATVVADALNVKNLTAQERSRWNAVREAQQKKTAMSDLLSAQEAWFARNEVVKFARNRRHSKSLLNFARAMAGLPEWGWFHSRRTCEAIQDKTDPTYPHKLFELLNSVIRKTRPLSLSRVQRRCRQELLDSDADPLLRAYVKPQWFYLEEAIQFCKGVKRSELPFKIMDRFIYHCERGRYGTLCRSASHEMTFAGFPNTGRALGRVSHRSLDRLDWLQILPMRS